MRSVACFLPFLLLFFLFSLFLSLLFVCFWLFFCLVDTRLVDEVSGCTSLWMHKSVDSKAGGFGCMGFLRCDDDERYALRARDIVRRGLCPYGGY